MEKELITLIEKLAAQLGQTAEAMWHILIAQAQIAAITNGIIGTLLTIFAIILVICSIRCYKDDDNDALTACVIFTCIFFIASFLFWFPAITAYYNPEYWALEKLIEMV